jgi:hypothetical protein
MWSLEVGQVAGRQYGVVPLHCGDLLCIFGRVGGCRGACVLRTTSNLGEYSLSTRSQLRSAEGGSQWSSAVGAWGITVWRFPGWCGAVLR